MTGLERRQSRGSSPEGLDLPAVLGSQRAYDLLDAVYHETAYANYDEQMAKLRSEFAALPLEDWTQNLYWSWLYALRPLLDAKGEGYPSFMRTMAWLDKDLHTMLGSWTELRHDTILYAKQSTTIRLTAFMPPQETARGYVEPALELYARLAGLAAQTRSGLQAAGLLGDEYERKLASFEDFLHNVQAMAEKELEGKALSEDEYALLREVGGYLEGLTTFSAREAGRLSSEADRRMAVVADVHTDSNSEQALEEAVGDAFSIYVLAPVEGALALLKGGVFSYYEFTVPLAGRLTDEAWQAKDPRPEQPEWTKRFVG